MRPRWAASRAHFQDIFRTSPVLKHARDEKSPLFLAIKSFFMSFHQRRESGGDGTRKKEGDGDGVWHQPTQKTESRPASFIMGSEGDAWEM